MELLKRTEEYRSETEQETENFIQDTDTSGYGFPTPLTRKRSTNCAIS